jgi:hypothetical protein
MISQGTEFRLIQTVTSQKIGEEIATRLAVSTTPSTSDDAQDILDILDPRSNKSIEERLSEDLAGDGDGSAGTELARKINGMVRVLQAKAASISLTASKTAMGNQHMSLAHFEVLVDALADRPSAEDFRSAYNTMVDSIYATV